VRREWKERKGDEGREDGQAAADRVRLGWMEGRIAPAPSPISTIGRAESDHRPRKSRKTAIDSPDDGDH
jgi:hypothetical protein